MNLLTKADFYQAQLVYESIDETRWQLLWFLYAYNLSGCSVPLKWESKRINIKEDNHE